MKTCSCAAILSTIGLAAPAMAGEPINKQLELQEISFAVQATNDGSINRLTIIASGPSVDGAVVETEIDGTVSGAEVGDLDANGFPEIYVYVTSAGSGSYGSLVAYAVTNGKGLSPIQLPPLEDVPQNAAGYMGHDEFAVLEGALGRRFPLYSSGIKNLEPMPTYRQLQYKLTKSAAGWVLSFDRMSEF